MLGRKAVLLVELCSRISPENSVKEEYVACFELMGETGKSVC